MAAPQEAFPAYAELLEMTSSYGSVGAFEAMLRQTKEMEQSRGTLDERGAPLSARGKRFYANVSGVQDFTDNACASFDAANLGDMKTAERAAQTALQYKQTFFQLFNRGFDPRSGQRPTRK